MDSNSWRLCLLGNFRLEHDGAVVTTFARRRQDALLAYLALTPERTNARWTVAELFWPGKPRRTTLNRLAEVLTHLGKQLDEAGVSVKLVDSRYQTIRLDPGIRTDVQDFDDLIAVALREAEAERKRELLEQALQMYGAGLLPVLDEPWIEDERQRLAQARDFAVGLLAESVGTAAGMKEGAGGLSAASVGQYLARGHAEGAAPPSLSWPARETIAMPDALGVDGGADRWRGGPLSSRALAEACQRLLEAAAPHLSGPDRKLWFDRLDTKRSDIHDSIEWAIEHEQADLALRLTAPMWRYWYDRGRIGEGRLLLDRALILAGVRGGRTYALAAQASGALALHDGDKGAARRRLQEALAIWRDIEDAEGIGAVLDDLGIVAYKENDLVNARRYYAESLAVMRQIGDPQRLVAVLRNAALVEMAEGRPEAAEAYFQERLGICRTLGDDSAIAWTLMGLVGVGWDRHSWADLQPLVLEARAICESHKDLPGLGQCFRALGYGRQLAEQFDAAAAFYESSLSMCRAARDVRGMGESIRYLAEVAESQGDFPRAKDWYRQAALLLDDIGDWEGAEKVRQAQAEIKTQ